MRAWQKQLKQMPQLCLVCLKSISYYLKFSTLSQYILHLKNIVVPQGKPLIKSNNAPPQFHQCLHSFSFTHQGLKGVVCKRNGRELSP